MTSIRNSKTKLQPLYYPQHALEGDHDLDNDAHLLELYNDPDTAPNSSQGKEISPKNKHLKSLKAALYKDVISSEGVLSSDGEDVFSDLSKPGMGNQRGMGKNKIPVLIRKSNMEPKMFKPVLSNGARLAQITPNKGKITENTHEEEYSKESVEEEPVLKVKQGNKENEEKQEREEKQGKKGVKHQSDKKEKKNKENMENGSPVFQSQQLDRKSLGKMSLGQSKGLVKNLENNVNQERLVTQSLDSNQLKNVQGLRERKNDEILEQQRHHEEVQPVKMMTEVGRGISEVSTEFYGKKSTTSKEIYKEVIREILTESDVRFQIPNRVQIASKDEKAAMDVVEERLGKRYAEKLYELFVQHCATKETHKKSMTLGKLLLFMKIFGMFEPRVTRETVNLTFVKRCPQKFADFASFVDILYKLQKLSDFDVDVQETENSEFSAKDLKFQKYLQAKIFNKEHHSMINSQLSLQRINSIESEFDGLGHHIYRVLVEYDEVLKKIFRSYWPWNNKYQGKTTDNRKGIITIKDYKQLCYDYRLVPSLCSLHQALELFRKFHKEGEEVVDYKGFIHVLCVTANLGFSQENSNYRFEPFAKKLHRFCFMLTEATHIVPERACR